MTIEKVRIPEAIVVEGRDDEIAVRRALDAFVIPTHGFGIRAETWNLIGKADQEKGIIILTDPDFSGEEIRRKITARYPNAKQAYLPREEAIRGSDIGVENASPESILRAVEKARTAVVPKYPETGEPITMQDLSQMQLSGCPDASERRAAVGAVLGIGYGNSRTFLRKLHAFGIDRQSLEEAVEALMQSSK